MNESVGCVLQADSAQGLSVAGNTAVTVLSGGNVGIGTTNPTAKFQVIGGNGNITNDTDGYGSFSVINPNTGTSVYTQIALTNGANAQGTLRLGGENNSTDPDVFIIQSEANVSNGLEVRASAGALMLFAGSGEDMRIASNGDVGIGTTNPQGLLHVNGTAGNNTGTWSNLSDRRLKKDIIPIEGALETVRKLQGVTFRWKDTSRGAGLEGLKRGLIAQDVEAVIPEWVSTQSDGYKVLTKEGIEAVLIEAIKELKAENDALRSRVEALEAR